MQSVHQRDTLQRGNIARNTSRACKYSPNRDAQQAGVQQRWCWRTAWCTHGCSRAVNYLWWRVTRAAHLTRRKQKMKKKNPSVLRLALSLWIRGPQGEPCLMGVKRIYRKLKPTSRCVMGKTYSVSMTSGPCDCTEADFEW